MGKARDHRAVTDIHAELIARPTARCVGVESGPQSLRPDPSAVADLQVLGRHRPSAHAAIQQPIVLPEGMDAARPLRYLFVGQSWKRCSGPGLVPAQQPSSLAVPQRAIQVAALPDLALAAGVGWSRLASALLCPLGRSVPGR
jgi:hypothetical protein